MWDCSRSLCGRRARRVPHAKAGSYRPTNTHGSPSLPYSLASLPLLVDRVLRSRRTLHALKVIVHPMLSQFYGVLLGFRLGWGTNRIMQIIFSLPPRDNCMPSPDSLCIIRRDRDYVALIYDLFHLEESEDCNLKAITKP